MFYSEQLLSKTGPLARVWLASNVERKLSKSQILQSDISSSVGVIVDQGQAPMALRLSGQLMLGVVRIYGRKARYLLDDCNEALLKIRMTFKATNSHDLPAHATTTVDLNLSEMLTIDDLFPAMDFGFALTQQPALNARESEEDMEEDWTSSLAPQKSTQSFLTPDDPMVGGDDLGLDFGDDIGMEDTTLSMQLGRGGHAARRDEPMEGPAIFDDGEDLGLDLGDDVDMPEAPEEDAMPEALEEDAMPTINDLDQDAAPFADDETEQLRIATATDAPENGSPQPEAVSEFIDEPEVTGLEQHEVEVVAAQRQKSRKQKPLIADKETVLHNSEIKANAADRSKILLPASAQPKDPFLQVLMNMQKNGDFVINAMNDGRSKHWAPEIQGLLSFEVVHRSGQLKRKRDSGIADLSDDERSDKSPRLDHAELEDENLLEDEGIVLDQDSPQQARGDAGQSMMIEEDDEIFAADGGFDDTTMPLVHPADSGPISLGTKRAVHLLRDTFGGELTDESPASQARKSVLLQDLVPEGRTSRQDATKMFFEILVLATKDAIKVDQADKKIGMPLRIRAKRGLWGSWAEAVPNENIGSQDVAVSA